MTTILFCFLNVGDGRLLLMSFLSLSVSFEFYVFARLSFLSQILKMVKMTIDVAH